MKLNKHGSDKRPQYMDVYQRICEQLPREPIIIELGVLNGESLKMWLDAFPDGCVFGVDINPDAQWPAGAVKIVANQTDAQAIAAFTTVAHLIVDDASHNYAATKTSFDHLWPMVAPGGWYVVEDWDAGFLHPHEHTYAGMHHIAHFFGSAIIYGCHEIAESVIVPGLAAVRKARG